ncbi:MAG: hypothetical protein AB7Y46_02975 [Armatimonadota bacterium]
MNRLVIMTVGTSLLENKGGEDRAGCDPIKRLNEAATRLSAHRGAVAHRDPVLAALRALDPAYEFGLRTPPRDPRKTDRLPAELSYLYVLLRDRTEGGTQTQVVLLPSDTPEGEACAAIIAAYLAQNANRHENWPPAPLEVEVEPRTNLTGLQVEDAERFRTEGIPNLVCAIRKHALAEENGAAKWNEVILNFTGGFKAAIPYETFAAPLLERPGVRVHYLFEATPHILELPQYPIGLDFPRWHRHDMMLRAAWERPELYRVPDERMQAIQDAGARPVEGSLEAVLHERYQAQLARDPLQDYSVAVIDHFVTDAELKQRLKRILPAVGPLLWMGDKISMAADHAARHHHNLLEFAQVLLTPLPPGFLSERERFVLLAALMLHDCGHTLDALPLDGREDRLVPLFPSEVRGYHHFLAYRRLTTPELAADVGWDPNADLAEAVAWLCFYHRKKTGWAERGSASECPFWQPEPATCTVLDAGRRFRDDIDLPKLVALLRIIDGCDNQSRRVGPNPLPDMMQRLFATDARTHHARVKQLLPAAAAAFPTDKFIGRVRNWLDAGGAPPKVPADTRARMARCHSLEAALWTALAREVDECRLRHNQFVHFLKHQGVRSVRILPADDFNAEHQWHFSIELEPDQELKGDNGQLLIDDASLAKENAEEIGDRASVRDWIWEGVAGELQAEALNYLARQAKVQIKLHMRWTDGEGDPSGKCFKGTSQA